MGFFDFNDTALCQSYRDYWVRNQLLSAEVASAYLDSLISHIRFVQDAGQGLHVPSVILRHHDQSKFDPEEFYAYAQHFYGDGAPTEFALAWLRHIHRNKHHWQHWIFPDGWELEGVDIYGGALVMPEVYVREMISDWMGASMAYTGSWDMTEWLHNNLHRIRLHPKAMQIARAILTDELRYNWEDIYRLGQ